MLIVVKCIKELQVQDTSLMISSKSLHFHRQTVQFVCESKIKYKVIKTVQKKEDVMLQRISK